MAESVEDITAAEIAPSPKNDTHVGVKYWSTMGRTNLVSAIVPLAVRSLCGAIRGQSKEENNKCLLALVKTILKHMVH